MVRKAKLRCHGSRGRRRLTGLRDDAPSEARGADGGRATHGHTKPPPDGHHSGDKAAPRRTPPWHERAHPRRTPPGHDKAAHGHTHHPGTTKPPYHSGTKAGLSVTNVVLKFRV